MKKCVDCEQSKPIDLFPKGRNRCKACTALWMKDYYARNPDKLKKNREKQRGRDKAKSRFTRHRITEEFYLELLRKHNGKCWACRDREGFVIDHDHKCCPKVWSCGKCVRGVLCTQCNTALGLLAENETYIKNLIIYLGE